MSEFIKRNGSDPFEELKGELNEIKTMISQLTASKNKENDIVMMDGAMEITGLQRQTIYGHVCRGTIPYQKKYKKLYFSRTELKEWILSGKKKVLGIGASAILK